VVWVNIFVAQQFWINIFGPIGVWVIIFVDQIRWKTLIFERENDMDKKIPRMPFTTYADLEVITMCKGTNHNDLKTWIIIMAMKLITMII